MSITIVTRAEWGARSPKAVHRISLPTPRLWVHHTADDRQGAAAVRAHQDFHMDTKGWNDIAYSFLIGDDGTIFEGRGAGVAGGHTAGDNTTSHGICLLGNFEGHPATAAALDSLVALAQHGRDSGWWVPTLGGHRDAPGALTACPGRLLYAALPDVRARVAAPIQEEDMTPAQEATLNAVAVAVFAGKPNEIARQVWALKIDDLATQTGSAADLMRKIRAEAGEDVDEAAVAAAVLAVLTPEAIAAAIPDSLASDVADELHQRLAD